MDITIKTIGYLIYLPIILMLVLYVAKTLFKNSITFMIDIFSGNEEVANSTNKLFELGFYLMNIGFAFFILEMHHIAGTEDLVVALASKIGGFSIYLGIILLLNLFLFLRGRKKSINRESDLGLA